MGFEQTIMDVGRRQDEIRGVRKAILAGLRGSHTRRFLGGSNDSLVAYCRRDSDGIDGDIIGMLDFTVDSKYGGRLVTHLLAVRLLRFRRISGLARAALLSCDARLASMHFFLNKSHCLRMRTGDCMRC